MGGYASREQSPFAGVSAGPVASLPAAYAAVDRAETPEGRGACWAANAAGSALMARTCAEHGVTLVHVSSDYVFDGAAPGHGEDEPLSPLGVYGQSKAAGDLAVSCCPRHYVVRSSWVIGDGRNFVRTMKGLSVRIADPSDALGEVAVVDDQLGHLTFADQMAEGILHLFGCRDGDVEPGSPTPYGAYNLTGSGSVESWVRIAARVFDLANGNGAAVAPATTAEYYASAEAPVAPHPERSDLDFSKVRAAGLEPCDWTEELAE